MCHATRWRRSRLSEDPQNICEPGLRYSTRSNDRCRRTRASITTRKGVGNGIERVVSYVTRGIGQYSGVFCRLGFLHLDTKLSYLGVYLPKLLGESIYESMVLVLLFKEIEVFRTDIQVEISQSFTFFLEFTGYMVSLGTQGLELILPAQELRIAIGTCGEQSLILRSAALESSLSTFTYYRRHQMYVPCYVLHDILEEEIIGRVRLSLIHYLDTEESENSLTGCSPFTGHFVRIDNGNIEWGELTC